MRIYSMTATFGKLSHQTLTLEPGFNIIEAPNEWGKSTWCAFLVAMLYGINTREQSKTGFLADKEHYTPWSGEPMSGRMDINWNGKDITIERRNKGRGFFNDFKAYETRSGLPVAELTAANCGQTLLGIEQSVFIRAGFLRQSELPVTEDEKLRSRLNALVTTGDESGASEELYQKLKDLKNRCRFNKSGLLPQAEAQRDRLRQKLTQLRNLHDQSQTLTQRQADIKKQLDVLQNHKNALEYEAVKAYNRKLEQARLQYALACQRAEELQRQCQDIPEEGQLKQKLSQVQDLRQQREYLQTQAQLRPEAPQIPQAVPQFQGVDYRQAVQQAKQDRERYDSLQSEVRKPSLLMPVLGGILLLAGVILLLLPQMTPGVILIAVGIVLTVMGLITGYNIKTQNLHLQTQAQLLAQRYQPLSPDQWETAARQYAVTMDTYQEQLECYRVSLSKMDAQVTQLKARTEELTGGSSIAQLEQQLLHQLEQRQALEAASRDCSRAEDLVRTLQLSYKEVPVPAMEDTMELSQEKTLQQIAQYQAEQAQLQRQMGQCIGQMEALGQVGQLEEQLEVLEKRIGELEKIYEAAAYGMQIQQTASQELQRRFAPRISQKAQKLMGRLTGGRYDRLVLDRELQLSSAAEGEDTLRSNLWRSSGTTDQLYLALRLAVAQELTPQAPFVLDDAFVRFDEERLAAALEILKEEAEEKQIIIFTCQSRETAWYERNKEENL